VLRARAWGDPARFSAQPAGLAWWRLAGRPSAQRHTWGLQHPLHHQLSIPAATQRGGVCSSCHVWMVWSLETRRASRPVADAVSGRSAVNARKRTPLGSAGSVLHKSWQPGEPVGQESALGAANFSCAPSPTLSPTDPVPAGPRTRHLARKLGIPDGQNTLGPHGQNTLGPPRSGLGNPGARCVAPTAHRDRGRQRHSLVVVAEERGAPMPMATPSFDLCQHHYSSLARRRVNPAS